MTNLEKSHLLVSEERSKWLHHYTADVKRSFLDKLDGPGATPAPDSGLDVEHRRILIEPYDTMQQRLAESLGVEWTEEMRDGGGL